MKRVNVILTPNQKKIIDFKLKQAKKLRLVKALVYDDKISYNTKLSMIRSILI